MSLLERGTEKHAVFAILDLGNRTSENQHFQKVNLPFVITQTLETDAHIFRTTGIIR